jgi:hypothetical protein
LNPEVSIIEKTLAPALMPSDALSFWKISFLFFRAAFQPRIWKCLMHSGPFGSGFAVDGEVAREALVIFLIHSLEAAVC